MFATYVTSMGDPGDMVCFNVLSHMVEGALLSTDVACGNFALAISR